MKHYETAVSRARGLGSAKSGFRHWWMQRVTALVLIPLILYFGFGLAIHAGADYETAREWVAGPISATFWIVLIAAIFYHAALGLQVVLEDYVKDEGLKVGSIILTQAICAVLGVGGVLAVIRIALGS